MDIDQDNLHIKFSALNADFSSLSLDLLRLMKPAHAVVKDGYSLKVVIFMLFAYLAWKRLQAITDVLLIMTSTGDMLLVVSKSMILNDPEPHKYGF